ncbi:G-type lectin S-receptor-like serine/threonine-protein kinase, partial [Glycine soja]
FVVIYLFYCKRRVSKYNESKDIESSEHKEDEEMAQKEDLMIFQGGEDLTICHILDAPGEVMGKSNYGTLDKSLRAKRSNKVSLLRKAIQYAGLGMLRNKKYFLGPMIEWIRGRLAFKDNIRAGREVGDQLSIEWSVATASSLEYSAMSDYDDQRQWVPQWAAVSNPSDIAGVCGNGVCNLDKNCDCVASIYGLNEERSFCWVLRSFSFGGFQDTSSTLFVKVRANGSWTLEGHAGGSNSSSDGMGSAKEKVVIIPTVLSMVVLIVLLSLLLYFSVHRKRTLKREMESSFILSGAPMSFTYRNLQIRTCNFTQLLGTGEFGSVYKGSLRDGTLVAVKKLDRVLPHGEKEFITEVNTIGSMHHMNLVCLCGYCSEGSHRLLVYEFMKNGSLDKWIFPSYQGRDRLLDWTTHLNIAIATEQGIAYFHEQCRDRIIHCDIKPENILVDENFCPKVSDFGLAKLMGREHSHVVTMVKSTRGYLAPEWVSNRPIAVKADIYSYGMLILEIIGGWRNLDMSFGAEDFFYLGWAYKEMTNGSIIKVADRR